MYALPAPDLFVFLAWCDGMLVLQTLAIKGTFLPAWSVCSTKKAQLTAVVSVKLLIPELRQSSSVLQLSPASKGHVIFGPCFQLPC